MTNLKALIAQAKAQTAANRYAFLRKTAQSKTIAQATKG
jgi:hypothetical protein